MGKIYERPLHRRYLNSQEAHVKTLNIIGDQGNAHETHNEIPIHTHEIQDSK